MWWLVVGLLTGLYGWLSVRLRPQLALGIVVPMAMLTPAWLILPLFPGAPNSIVGSGIDIKVAVGTLCLILYCFLPGRTFPLRLVPCDFAVLGLLLVHLLSDVHNSGFSWLIPGRTYAEWYVPYMAGRLAVQARQDLIPLWPWMAGMGCALGLASCFEALTGHNLFEILWGLRPLEGFSRDASRWGLKRAYGPTMHPIYLGVLQTLLLGWAAYAAIRAGHRRAPWWWLISPLLVIAGIVASGSRGPIVGLLISGSATVFFLVPKARLPLGLLTVLVLSGAISQREYLLDQLEIWGAEAAAARPHQIVIGQEKFRHSGTRNRLNLWEVYRSAVARSGLLGFGTQAVAGFPVKVPIGAQEATTLRQVKYIDNEYVLLALRFGILGVMCFVLAGMCAIGQFLRLSKHYPGQSPHWIGCSLAAALVTTFALLLTVWMPHEIGFPLLWTMGISSGLIVSHLQGQLAAPVSMETATVS